MKIQSEKQYFVFDNNMTKDILEVTINWYQRNFYSQGDSYYAYFATQNNINNPLQVFLCIGHSNDKPMEHGNGKSIYITIEDLIWLIDDRKKSFIISQYEVNKYSLMLRSAYERFRKNLKLINYRPALQKYVNVVDVKKHLL